jgi:alpha-1,2-mannosyltransferase
VFTSLNIVKYNLFSRFGPDLYGTEPASYYFANLFLNFNIFTPLALASLPALAITYKYDFRRLGKTQMKPKVGESSPYLLLATRLAPFYIWLGILTLQKHKEERFMFPAYPLLCFNAAVTVFLVRGWLETIFVSITKSPYRASQSSMFSWFTLAAIIVPSILSIGRIIGIFKFYHAPLDVMHHFQYETLPSVLKDLGFAPIPYPKGVYPKEGELPEWDLSPIAEMDPPITICYGAEWHRFPGSYLVPEGVEIQWIQSEFNGMMPRRWEPSENDGLWPRAETRVIRPGRFNGANQASAEVGTYVSMISGLARVCYCRDRQNVPPHVS